MAGKIKWAARALLVAVFVAVPVVTTAEPASAPLGPNKWSKPFESPSRN
ncbi:hypothetical protein GCM10020369_21470 [Cryptosporangium minutisporangium]|uniref:Uncharacterized protein n=1 Tax=Cryptosporangium minutisporangium TaxID=113569 RepID=A0ABP6SUM4_9ACTN